MPLRTSFIVVIFFSRSTNDQVACGGFMPPERPANMGLVRLIATLELAAGGTVWQDMQRRVSLRMKRVAVSVLRPARTSMVQASTGQPAFSTRFTSFSVSSHVVGM